MESLEDLTDYERKVFKDALSRSQRGKLSSKNLQQITDPQELGIFIVQTFGEESLTVTRDALEEIGRTDLAQASSHSNTIFRSKVMKVLDLEKRLDKGLSMFHFLIFTSTSKMIK